MRITSGKVARILWGLFALATITVIMLVISIWVNLFGLFGEIPGFAVLENPRSDVATQLYSYDGEVLGSFYTEFRDPITYDELGPYLKKALVATEDERFERHAGIDMKGTFAIPFYLLQGKRRGSSTITQQTAKNLFRLRQAPKYQGSLSDNMVVTKIKEWMTAIRLERSYTKEEILMMYLNTVSFNYNSFGIKSAAQIYFGKSPDELEIHEAALLVGMLQNPSLYNPFRYPERTTVRRNVVLSQMVKNDYLQETAYDTIKEKSLSVNYSPVNRTTGMAPYFTESVRPWLEEWAAENDADLYADGLRIYTSIDARMQKYAESAVEKHMKSLQEEFDNQWKNRNVFPEEYLTRLIRQTPRYRSMKKRGMDEKDIIKELNKPVDMEVFTWEGQKEVKMSPVDSIRHYNRFLHTGMMSMDPHSGFIKAYVGGIDYRNFSYDHVKQSQRQPGSTFKPFVYAYAMEEKELTPCSKVMDVQQPYRWGDGIWNPKNAGGKYCNCYLTLKEGLKNSVNSVAAYLMMQAEDPQNIVDFAKKFGISTDLQAVPSLALGTSEVTVHDMVTAYSVFVNGGHYIKPVSIMRIEDKYGEVLYENKPNIVEVLNEKTAKYMVELLESTKGGTARKLVTDYGFGDYAVGGKTGTTNDAVDGWFMGVSPDLVTGVWVGGKTSHVKFRYGNIRQGAYMALPIWGLYMDEVFHNKELNIEKENFRYQLDSAYTDCEEVDEPVELDPTHDEEFEDILGMK